MDYFGITLIGLLISGNKLLLDSLGLKSDESRTFKLTEEIWEDIYLNLVSTMKDAGLEKNLGLCLHLLPDLPVLLKRNKILGDFLSARDKFAAKFPLEMGYHAPFKEKDIINAGNFIKVFKRSIKYCELIGSKTIVEHPANNFSKNLDTVVEKLTSEPIMELLRNTDIEICWENMPAKTTQSDGSLKAMIEFRETLGDKLKEIGDGDMINRHIFCFDTGHLLIWRHNFKGGIAMADKEIEEYLPLFAKKIKVFHIHANDGYFDSHLVPFAYLPKSLLMKFSNISPDYIIDKAKFMEYSDLVMDWQKVCEENKSINERHLHVEALNIPFSLKKITEFGKKLNEII
ncbi:MAG: TIM barrel protein [archaeon]|nr:TIM barrel protein [archaeon]